MGDITANAAMMGKNCPYCQTPIKPGTTVHVCDACGIPHHIECWRHNGGCTTFGCRESAEVRGQAGAPQPGYQAPPPQYAQPPQQIYPGQYPQQYAYQDAPPEVRNYLNWGAFFLPLFWSIANNVWIGLLCLIPYLGWIMSFVLLFKGSEMAWKNRRFDSVQHFEEVQGIWNRWGIGVFIASVCFGFLIGLISALSSGHSGY